MRLFNKRQKKILSLFSGNICQICKKIVTNNSHADHKKPFSKNGKTTLLNGQILCPECNISKGAKYE